VEIPFEGGTLPGILRIPRHAGREAGVPVVILIAGLDSTKEEFFGGCHRGRNIR
jgi:hypothetical protein